MSFSLKSASSSSVRVLLLWWDLGNSYEDKHWGWLTVSEVWSVIIMVEIMAAYRQTWSWRSQEKAARKRLLCRQLGGSDATWDGAWAEESQSPPTQWRTSSTPIPPDSATPWTKAYSKYHTHEVFSFGYLISIFSDSRLWISPLIPIFGCSLSHPFWKVEQVGIFVKCLLCNLVLCKLHLVLSVA